MKKHEAADPLSGIEFPASGEFRPSETMAAAVVVLSLIAGSLIGVFVAAFL